MAPIRSQRPAGATRESAAVKNGMTEATAVPAAPASTRWMVGQTAGRPRRRACGHRDESEPEEPRRDEQAREGGAPVVGPTDDRENAENREDRGVGRVAGEVGIGGCVGALSRGTGLATGLLGHDRDHLGGWWHGRP